MDVILLSEEGQRIGTCPKELVHTTDTVLHQAFSCHARNEAGEVLVTRRALSKVTWPGVWTNSFCGHPQPGESFEEAIARHAMRTRFQGLRYRAGVAGLPLSGRGCLGNRGKRNLPGFPAVIDSEITANPDEVMDYCWVDPAKLGQALRATPWAFSPWLVMQAKGIALYAA